MDYSGHDFVTRALRLLNVIDAFNDPAPEMLVDGFQTLNELVDAWENERRLIQYEAPNQHALTQNQQSYTVGPGGDFDQVRPVILPHWSVVPDRNASSVLKIDRGRPLTIDEWRRIAVQVVTSAFPTAIYFDHAWAAGLGNIMVWPIPDNDNVDIILWTPTPLAQFADLATIYSFAPGYARAIRYNLAVELAIDYPGALTDEVKARAIDAKAWVKRANTRPAYAQFDAGFIGTRGRKYNVYTDE